MEKKRKSDSPSYSFFVSRSSRINFGDPWNQLSMFNKLWQVIKLFILTSVLPNSVLVDVIQWVLFLQ